LTKYLKNCIKIKHKTESSTFEIFKFKMRGDLKMNDQGKSFLKFFCRGVIALVVAIIIMAMIECPETLAKIAISTAAAVFMIGAIFKKFLPKPIVSGTKNITEKFWKYVF
jgi:hypothetical protein